jgi:Na+/H+ antiporter NhaD/arsenite permease-like protein
VTEVGWKTILFLIGLDIVVGELAQVGAIRLLSQQLVAATEHQVAFSTIVVVWGAALLFALIDNVPFVDAMNPLIIDVARTLHPDVRDYTSLVHQPDVLPVWWALALGACRGECTATIGAAANVVVVDAARRAGHITTFARFCLSDIRATVGALALTAVYLWIRLLR